MKSIPADRPFLPPVPGLTSTLERTPDSIRGIEQFERLGTLYFGTAVRCVSMGRGKVEHEGMKFLNRFGISMYLHPSPDA
jgi:hypothetical protein